MDDLPRPLSLSFSLCIDLRRDMPTRILRFDPKEQSRHTINADCWCFADHVVRQEDAAPHEPATERRPFAVEHLSLSLSFSLTSALADKTPGVIHTARW